MTLSQRSELSLQLHSCFYLVLQSFLLFVVIWWRSILKPLSLQFKRTPYQLCKSYVSTKGETSSSPLLSAQLVSANVRIGMLESRDSCSKNGSRWLPLYRAKGQWQCLLWTGRSYIHAEHALLHEPSPSLIRTEPPQISWWQCNPLCVCMCNNLTDRLSITSH